MQSGCHCSNFFLSIRHGYYLCDIEKWVQSMYVNRNQRSCVISVSLCVFRNNVSLVYLLTFSMWHLCLIKLQLPSLSYVVSSYADTYLFPQGPFIYYVSTCRGEVRKCQFLLILSTKNMLTQGGGGSKNPKNVMT